MQEAFGQFDPIRVALQQGQMSSDEIPDSEAALLTNVPAIPNQAVVP